MMMQRRKRVVAFYQHASTHLNLKKWAGRNTELIAAGDLPTMEAAIKLYGQIDAVLAEQTAAPAALQVLRLARDRHPASPRVMILDHEAISTVFAAVHEGVVNEMVFLPLSFSAIDKACGFTTPVPVPVESATRLRQPPLTGGIRASSSPSLSR